MLFQKASPQRGLGQFLFAWLSVDLNDPEAKFEYMVPIRALFILKISPMMFALEKENEWRVTGFLWDLIDLHEDLEDSFKNPLSTIL